MNDTDALRIARDAYAASTTYVDANFRKQWEDALRMFQSKHPMDSKYNSEAYKFRSKLFRPKTRSVIRKNEAAAASAYFSNVDVVNVSASNERDPKQVMAAALYKELLQYRLTKSVPWFMTCIGGYQDAMTVGVVCSYQSWKYRESRKGSRSYFMDENLGMPIMGIEGGPLYQEQSDVKVLEDRPSIELRPVENIRIDRGAVWTDPVNTSPYVIDLIPMYLGDVKLMGRPNPKTGEPGWTIPADSVLQAATRQSYDPTRQVREGNREDSKEGGNAVNEFSIVWVHKNIVRKEGEDFCYYTLGTEHLLCPPRPIEEYYFHGERPYVMGCAIIETHKIYPGGYPELGKEVQKEINEVTNSRMDNVKLVMNKRYIVKRGAQVDLKSLVRNVAASITMANSPTEDVKTIEYNDVTGSSYAEQDRLNVEMDELVGNFSQSSVMTNRKLNETVGGMAMMGQGANLLTEYGLRTFTETWVEPVLQQFVKLEKHYETDETILELMGQKIGGEVTDEMLDTDVELTVNVGMGATDPMMKLNKLLAAAKAFTEISASQAPLDILALGKEIFGYVGYRDGGRFIKEGQDPKLAQAMGMIKALQNALGQAQEALENKDALEDAEIKERAVKLQDASRKIAAEIDKLQADTLQSLAKAGVQPDAALRALGASPETPTQGAEGAIDGVLMQAVMDLGDRFAAPESLP